MILNIVKIFSILGALALGVFGARYDYKTEGKLTKHGKIAILGILLFGSVSVLAQLIQYNDELDAANKAKREADVARERLEEENKKQSEILGNTREADRKLSESIKKQEAIGQNLTTFSTSLENDFRRQYHLSQELSSSQNEAKRLMNESFQRVINFTDENFDRVTRLTNDSFSRINERVEDFDKRVARNVDRLSNPLTSVFVSYEILYSHADKRFPRYFSKMKELHERTKNLGFSGPDYLDHGLQGEMIIRPTRKVCPDSDDRDAAFFCYDDNRQICFLSHNAGSQDVVNPDNLRIDLQLLIYSWIQDDYSLVKDKIEKGRINTVQRGVRTRLTFDFKNNTINQWVRLAPVEVNFRSPKFTSKLDITDPRRPADTFFQFVYYADKNFAPPQLLEVTLYFDEDDLTVNNSFRIEGDMFKMIPRGADGLVILTTSVQDIYEAYRRRVQKDPSPRD